MGRERGQRFPRVADALTLYLWRVPALRLADWAAAAGLPSTTFLVAEIFLSPLVFACFWLGRYWLGLLIAVAVMILSAARVTVDGSRLAQVGGALIAILWWFGWAHGLSAYGRPLEPVYATMVLWVVAGGAVTIAIIEALSIHRFRMDLHAWRPFDSRFRLVSAGPNTNLVILAIALLFGRPDSGFVAVAWWTLISLIVHAVRLAQLTERQARRLKIESWLDP